MTTYYVTATSNSITEALAYLAGLEVSYKHGPPAEGTASGVAAPKYPTLRVDCEHGLGYTIVDPEVAAMRLLEQHDDGNPTIIDCIFDRMERRKPLHEAIIFAVYEMELERKG
jgi:hypothetical protein